MDEQALVGRAIRGDRAAFASLVLLHQGRLRGLVALSVARPDDVHDIVQDAFIDAWRGLPGFAADRDFGPWLRTICRNRVHRFLRERLPRQRREVALVDEALLAVPADDRVADESADGRLAALRQCIDALGEEPRRLLTLRFHDEQPVQQIAAGLGRSPNAVSMLLLRIKASLQRCVEQRLAGANQ
jgi:RNA polymerase sigma-70 factor (ECF subfamily)